MMVGGGECCVRWNLEIYRISDDRKMTEILRTRARVIHHHRDIDLLSHDYFLYLWDHDFLRLIRWFL